MKKLFSVVGCIVFAFVTLCPTSMAYNTEYASELDMREARNSSSVSESYSETANEDNESLEYCPDDIESEENLSIEEKVKVNRDPDSDVFYDIEAYECPSHDWEYTYDFDNCGDVFFAKYCLNCGKLENCPSEFIPDGFEWLLPDDGVNDTEELDEDMDLSDPDEDIDSTDTESEDTEPAESDSSDESIVE